MLLFVVYQDAYTKEQIYYEWKHGPARSIKAAADMRLSTFDLIGHPAWNITLIRTGKCDRS